LDKNENNIINIDGNQEYQLPPKRQSKTAGHGTRSKKRGLKNKKERAQIHSGGVNIGVEGGQYFQSKS
jgi:hypothetical protein